MNNDNLKYFGDFLFIVYDSIHGWLYPQPLFNNSENLNEYIVLSKENPSELLNIILSAYSKDNELSERTILLSSHCATSQIKDLIMTWNKDILITADTKYPNYYGFKIEIRS